MSDSQLIELSWRYLQVGTKRDKEREKRRARERENHEVRRQNCHSKFPFQYFIWQRISFDSQTTICSLSVSVDPILCVCKVCEWGKWGLPCLYKTPQGWSKREAEAQRKQKPLAPSGKSHYSCCLLDSFSLCTRCQLVSSCHAHARRQMHTDCAKDTHLALHRGELVFDFRKSNSEIVDFWLEPSLLGPWDLRHETAHTHLLMHTFTHMCSHTHYLIHSRVGDNVFN